MLNACPTVSFSTRVMVVGPTESAHMLTPLVALWSKGEASVFGIGFCIIKGEEVGGGKPFTMYVAECLSHKTTWKSTTEMQTVSVTRRIHRSLAVGHSRSRTTQQEKRQRKPYDNGDSGKKARAHPWWRRESIAEWTIQLGGDLVEQEVPEGAVGALCTRAGLKHLEKHQALAALAVYRERKQLQPDFINVTFIPWRREEKGKIPQQEGR